MITNLIVLARKWETGELFIGSRTQDDVVLPFRNIENMQPEEATRLLFKQHIDLHPNWADLKLLSCKKLNDQYHTVYYTYIPIDTTTNLALLRVDKVNQHHDFHHEILKSIRA